MFKNNFFRTTKNTAIAIAIVLGFSIGAKAENTKNIEALQVSCNPFAVNNLDIECNSNLNIEPQAEQIAQGRRGRKRKSKVDGYYGGFSLGLGFPSGEVGVGNDTDVQFPQPEYSNGFVGSLFGGVKLNKNLGADLEFLLSLGGVDSDELDDFTNDPANGIDIVGNFDSEGDYSAFALYLNPRFELPLNENGSLNLYASPGIGISQTNVNFTTDDDGEGNLSDIDSSTIGFTYQVKGGASFLISDTTGIFGQLRYASLPTDDNNDSINTFSVETGVKFNF